MHTPVLLFRYPSCHSCDGLNGSSSFGKFLERTQSSFMRAALLLLVDYYLVFAARIEKDEATVLLDEERALEGDY